jgi:hypothetical protein
MGYVPETLRNLRSAAVSGRALLWPGRVCRRHVARHPAEAWAVDRPPLAPDELRAIAAWLKERARMKVPATVKTFFVSERRRPLHRSTINLLLAKYAAARHEGRGSHD